MISRREFLKCLGMGGMALAMSSELSSKEQKKPNVVFILTDDLGYGDLSCYSGKNLITNFTNENRSMSLKPIDP